jgi:hypothetical protein
MLIHKRIPVFLHPKAKRIFSTHSKRMYSKINPPGLQYQTNYLSPTEYKELSSKLDSLHGEIKREALLNDEKIESRQHNLTSTQRSYQNIQITDSHSNRIKLEYFDTYGGKGHELLYFQRNQNLPDFARELVSKHLDPYARKLLTNDQQQERELEWKMTLNYYTKMDLSASNGNGEDLWPGFPFHTDIATNGDVTFIISFSAPAIMELKPNETSEDVSQIVLEPNSLLILANEVRWNWLHRIVPTGDQFEFEGNRFVRSQERKSMVFGCRFK